MANVSTSDSKIGSGISAEDAKVITSIVQTLDTTQDIAKYIQKYDGKNWSVLSVPATWGAKNPEAYAVLSVGDNYLTFSKNVTLQEQQYSQIIFVWPDFKYLNYPLFLKTLIIFLSNSFKLKLLSINLGMNELDLDFRIFYLFPFLDGYWHFQNKNHQFNELIEIGTEGTSNYSCALWSADLIVPVFHLR